MVGASSRSRRPQIGEVCLLHSILCGDRSSNHFLGPLLLMWIPPGRSARSQAGTQVAPQDGWNVKSARSSASNPTLVNTRRGYTGKTGEGPVAPPSTVSMVFRGTRRISRREDAANPADGGTTVFPPLSAQPPHPRHPWETSLDTSRRTPARGTRAVSLALRKTLGLPNHNIAPRAHFPRKKALAAHHRIGEERTPQ